MSSTYSDRLKVELMATGANANTWGNNTNTNLQVIDTFTAGYLAKSVAGSANITLTTGNADATAEAANKVIELTGALTGDITVFVPAVESNYVFFNNTSGSQTLTIAATGHTANGLAIAQGAYSHIYCEGSSNFKIYNAIDKIGATTVAAGKDLTAGGGNIILRSNGAVSATTFTGSGANLTGIEAFPSGTKQVFYQASAPTGWTQDTTAALNEAVMSIVTGSGGGTGGTTAYFSSFLATTDKTAADPDAPVSGSLSGTVGGHTLSTPELASHSHTFTVVNQHPNNNPQQASRGSGNSPGPTSTGSTGGGGSHSHPFTGSLSSATADVSVTVPAADVKYANVIIAAKD
jgi:hypothetical protein|tara:strand:+ start:1426 stop:2469 length:1044 start_codon:yes stop_codon:yes gene_type:complete